MTDKPKRICRVVGCEREANTPGTARGLCSSHYVYRNEYANDGPVPARPKHKVPDEPITDFQREVGAPYLEIDMGLVERSARIGCTNEEIVALLGCNRNTFYRHLKEDPTLKETIDRGREGGKAALRRFQWQNAENGNPTMQIWLGKQMLDQKDKLENSGTMDTNTRLIVELVGDAAPAVEHDRREGSSSPERFRPRLVNDVEFKG
jgi:hypothetical protein